MLIRAFSSILGLRKNILMFFGNKESECIIIALTFTDSHISIVINTLFGSSL
ncbi:hypothetical protein SAMN05877753_10957 [Bacillus oleivorans]|uniref:Uncharacterized protein n=1 Tax=Bacillus oleivorans TaxID=1448271 RepID=A0A285D3T2_9BACI|nr:hypothetical protein SAMN05877753_10957 [Bacillus oleivorans]